MRISDSAVGICASRRTFALSHRLMSDDYQRIEIITGTERRRRWSAEEKLRIVEETLTGGDSVSAVARRHGVAPNLLYRWRRLMTEGGAVGLPPEKWSSPRYDFSPGGGHEHGKKAAYGGGDCFQAAAG